MIRRPPRSTLSSSSAASDVYKRQSYVGLDLNPLQIEMAHNFHVLQRDKVLNNANCSCHQPPLFVQGDASALPFQAESFDVVLNVESSHDYPEFEDFVTEVGRVLAPLGTFFIADFRNDVGFAHMETVFVSAGFDVVAREDITNLVVASMREDEVRKSRLIDTLVPWYIGFLRPTVRAWAGVGNTTMKRAFASGTKYFRYQLQKQAR
eukprot:TRINITY_DN59948_c0_g1_i1.p1 TRINITY_DN59948_c0_g1~~TRINITY_DN59948_c0_g1_i1.p1  ORF type:complete len:207 (-),score=33.09 TRINITY_DN59948_c0_g1_i1:316-936(-)